MPKIYSNRTRMEIKENLMRIGTDLIKTYGMKKMSIKDITEKAGIAQGTFYNFFKSKEIFVCEIAEAYQEEINAEISTIILEKGGVDREDLRAFYQRIFLEDERSIYRYLSREDIQTIVTRLPVEYDNILTNAKDSIITSIEKIHNRKIGYDVNLIFNLIQVINITVENRDLLSEATFEKTVNIIIDNLMNEIFESN